MSAGAGSGESPAGESPASEFVACVAEELRVPITAVLGYVELLGRTDVLDDPSQRSQVLASLGAHARELRAVADALGDACAVGAEGGAATAVDCRALAAATASAFRESCGLGVLAEIDPDVGGVHGEARLLSAALQALLRQMSWGARRDSVLHLGVQGAGESVRFTVSAPPGAVPDWAEGPLRLGEW
ncbi:MAG: hypothetical protein IBX62_09820, partial [Coriobacteriia bacterium]|nr:hypothetical protein [Coriobacteriia bacterium]